MCGAEARGVLNSSPRQTGQLRKTADGALRVFVALGPHFLTERLESGLANADSS